MKQEDLIHGNVYLLGDENPTPMFWNAKKEVFVEQLKDACWETYFHEYPVKELIQGDSDLQNAVKAIQQLHEMGYTLKNN